jgi:hypothetical protein
MKTYKTTDKQIEFIIDGLDKFISFANDYCSDCSAYYENMEEANELYKKNPTTFFDDIGVDKKRFFDGLSYYRLMDIAKNIKNDIKNIHNTVIGMFINPEGNEYPIKVKEWLYDFKMFCYDDNGNLLSLEEQNNRLRNYPHFDASTKRPKCYNTQ